MCNACGFLCCASDEFSGCGCSCSVAACRECDDCGADAALDDGHFKGCPYSQGSGDADDGDAGGDFDGVYRESVVDR